MILGINFFDSDGSMLDTPIYTRMSSIELKNGTFDEMYLTIDGSTTDTVEQPTSYGAKDLVDLKFKGSIISESNSNVGTFKITKVVISRNVVGTDIWDDIAEFKYDTSTIYEFEDRYVQNGVTYRYAITPYAGNLEGKRLISDEIKVDFSGIYLTTKDVNEALRYDVSLGDITYNKDIAFTSTLNGQFPVTAVGSSNYRTGSITAMPLSQITEGAFGDFIDKEAEYVFRKKWTDFLNDGRAKVLRIDDGSVMLVMTHNAKVSHKDEALRGLASISFDFTEIGEVNYKNLLENDLIPDDEKLSDGD